jgi:hypothetical protein
MKESPFKYGSIVSSKFFTNREVELNRLKSNFLSGINTIIIAPRRWGKSSLIEKVVNELLSENTGIIPVTLDLFTVNSEKEFYEKYSKEIIKATSKGAKEWLNDAKRFFKTVIPKFHYSPLPEQDFSLSLDWNDTDNYTEDILDLPERIAVKKKIKIVVCIDEFQNLAQINNFLTLEKKLRSIWQKHKNTTYCLYGSKRHMMTDLFNSSSKPFYRFGDILFLDKISKEKWITFITRSFILTGKKIPADAALEIPELMQCHPWYVQQLSHYTWELTEKIASKKEVSKALDLLIRTNSPLYIRDCENLSNTQLNLLKAIASGETQLMSFEVMQKFNLGTPRNVTKNRDILFKNDFIDFSKKNILFVDPAFKLWFKKEYL